MKRPAALILLNPRARQGTGRRRFERIRELVCARIAPTLVELDRAGRWREIVAERLEGGVRIFIAAGGDGTVNALAYELYRRRHRVPLAELTLGGIGLGSSNDFHKPRRRARKGIALRIDHENAAPRDVVEVVYEQLNGRVRRGLFVISASVGVTARANARFNGEGLLLGLLKTLATPLAILYAALWAITTHRNIASRVRVGEGRPALSTSVTNLSLLKTPHLAGSFTFDTPVSPASGLMAVNLCERMGRARLLVTLANLLRGRFRGQRKTRCWQTDRLSYVAEGEEAFALELDGEVVRARRARFSVAGERIRLCS